VTTYEYDWLGLLTGATQTSPQGATLARVGYAYDVFGRMVKLSRGNNVTTEYTFTSADEIKTETTTHHGTVISDASYEYDTHGNLTNRVDTRTGSDTSAGLVTETTVYTYNAYNQLTSSSVYPGEISTNGIVPRLTPSLLTQYQIGVSGDVIKETVTQGQTVTVREFEANTLGQTIAITTNGVRAEQSYDLAGNLTQAANGTTYTYDVFNQAMTETHPGRTTTEHTYWVTGQRHTTSEESLDMSNSETATMYWDGNAVINDTHTRGITQVTGSYLIGAFRHTRTLSGVNADTNSPSETDLTSTNYYVTDRHGNTTATADTEGVVTAVYTYTDYGVPTEHIPLGNSRTEADRNPFQYAGEYTTQTGFQYLGTRIYDPKTFTFTTKDVAEQFNLYAYANSNPITLVDPTGQTAVSDMGDILMPVLGAILAFLGLAWAIPTGGATVNLISAGISIAVGLVDVGIAVAQVVDVFDDNFMDDHTAQILGFTSVALGFGAIAGAKLASRTAAAAAQRAAQQAETAASIATYRAAPTVEWDTAVAHVATRKSRIIVPQVPAHHHLRKALVQHPEYSKTSFVSWAFIGKANWWGPRELLDNIAGLADSHVFKIRRRIVESVYRPWYESFPLDTVSKNSVRQEINALPLVSPKSYKKAINDSVTSSYSSSSSSDNFGTDSENAIELNLLSSTY
jgi:RHS repeat-associated protein